MCIAIGWLPFISRVRCSFESKILGAILLGSTLGDAESNHERRSTLLEMEDGQKGIETQREHMYSSFL
jgi:hypothetical protein